jgi:FkbM family methyltransferase
VRAFWDVYGLIRSTFMYRLPGHTRRSRAFYRAFLKPGDLAFDIGAHLGDRIDAFRATGARVVAVEPQPAFQTALKVLYRRDRDVTIVPAAVGAAPGTARMMISKRTPTMSTLARDWAKTLPESARFADVRWDHEIEVELTTLDALIATHGLPAFTKIDVEGFEADVLEGCTRPLPCLSFEVIPAAPAVTTARRRVRRAARPPGMRALQSTRQPLPPGSRSCPTASPLHTSRGYPASATRWHRPLRMWPLALGR